MCGDSVVFSESFELELGVRPKLLLGFILQQNSSVSRQKDTATFRRCVL